MDSVMPPKKKLKCFLSADQQSFTMKIDSWTGTYSVSRVDSQISFYRRLRDRKGGAYADHYKQTVKALENLKARIAENGGKR